MHSCRLPQQGRRPARNTMTSGLADRQSRSNMVRVSAGPLFFRGWVTIEIGEDHGAPGAGISNASMSRRRETPVALERIHDEAAGGGRGR